MTKLNAQIATKKERNHSAKIFPKTVKIIWKLKFLYIPSERRKDKAKNETVEKEIITLSLNIQDGNNKGMFSSD